MTVAEILKMDIINGDTEIIIRDNDFCVLAQGKWFDDAVLEYGGSKATGLTWQDDNKVYIDVGV